MSLTSQTAAYENPAASPASFLDCVFPWSTGCHRTGRRVSDLGRSARETMTSASACRYEMTLTDPSRIVRGVWVIFDRGRDMLRYYGDPDVQAFAQRHDLALTASHSTAAPKSETGGDMNVDPSKGLGRALFSALTQLSGELRASGAGIRQRDSARILRNGLSGWEVCRVCPPPRPGSHRLESRTLRSAGG